MSNVTNSIYNIRFLDEAASKKTIIHNINPIVKLLVTILYSVVVISFGKYNIINLVPFISYPIIIFMLSEIPFTPVFKRVLIALSFVLGVGILNPIFDTKIYVVILGIGISGGWISFVSLMIKSILTLLAGLLLIATTEIEKIAWALRKLRVPKVFVVQFLLTHRYIFVLLEEVTKIVKAYNLRSPFKKGVSLKASGSLLGQMLLRALDRANRVYNAMIIRGFNGDFFYQEIRISMSSILYFLLWTLFFITARFVNISELLGKVLMGVIK